MFLSLAQKRRSIRKFKDKPVEADKMDILLEAVLRSPSSMGKSPWTFIVIEDKKQLQELSMSKQYGSAFVDNAPLAIVVCADPGISDVWIEDASIASIYIHLTAASLGLGSCWVQIRKRMHSETMSSQAYLADLLNIPDNINVVAMVAIGYPDEEKSSHKKETLQYHKLYHGAYGEQRSPSE